jgi:hypothetical protein
MCQGSGSALIRANRQPLWRSKSRQPRYGAHQRAHGGRHEQLSPFQYSYERKVASRHCRVGSQQSITERAGYAGSNRLTLISTYSFCAEK